MKRKFIYAIGLLSAGLFILNACQHEILYPGNGGGGTGGGGTYVSPSADLVAQCLTPESVCVARGPECPASSYCVAEGQDCATGAMTFPQHRPGSEKSACPTEKSRCCAPSSDGGTGDGGMTDGGSADAGTSDMSSSDAGVRG